MSKSLYIIALCIGITHPSHGRNVPRDTTSPQHGVASWYEYPSGRITSNGEFLDPDAMTAAHRTLPFGTMVRVTNLKTNASAIVRINDRGPFFKGGIIDLTKAAGQQIGIVGPGKASVTVEVISE